MIDLSDAAAGLPVRPGLDLLLQHESIITGASHYHSQVFAAGQLRSWRLGLDPDCAAILRRPVADSLLNVFGGGVAALIETAQWAWEYDGNEMCSSWPPTGEAAERIGRSLPRIPGASLTIGLTTSDLIDGALRYEQRFVDGHLVSAEFRDTGPAELELHVPLADYCRFLIGEMPFLDLMFCGRVRGGISQLSVITGLVEQDPFRAAITPFMGVAALTSRLTDLLNHPAAAAFGRTMAQRSTELPGVVGSHEASLICTALPNNVQPDLDRSGERHASS